MSDPKITEISVSYSAGVKANLGNYESGDIHISRSEKWDVSDMSEVESQEFVQERHNFLKQIVVAEVQEEYRELKE